MHKTRRRLVIIGLMAALSSFGLFGTAAPASANCIYVEGLDRCVENPGCIVARLVGGTCLE